jgi:hypothetical protein
MGPCQRSGQLAQAAEEEQVQGFEQQGFEEQGLQEQRFEEQGQEPPLLLTAARRIERDANAPQHRSEISDLAVF